MTDRNQRTMVPYQLPDPFLDTHGLHGPHRLGMRRIVADRTATCALSRESCVTVGRRVEKAAVAASDGEASPEHAANVTGSIATQQAATNRVKNP